MGDGRTRPRCKLFPHQVYEKGDMYHHLMLPLNNAQNQNNQNGQNDGNRTLPLNSF